MKLLSLLFLALLIQSCSRTPLEDPKKLFRPSSEVPALSDALPLESLKAALDRTISAYEKGGTIPADFHFAERDISRSDYELALRALAPELESLDRFHAFVKENFEFYEVY